MFGFVLHVFQNETRQFCADVNLSRKARHAYTLMVFLVYYVIPLAAITMFYAMMAQTLWTSVSPSFLRVTMTTLGCVASELILVSKVCMHE